MWEFSVCLFTHDFYAHLPFSMLRLNDNFLHTPLLIHRSIDDTDPIEQKSRITAFVSNDTGVFVECWEIDDLLPDAQITRKDGSKGTVRRKSMTDDDNFSGVDILTWPAYTQLWPPPLESVHAEWFDLSLFNKYVISCSHLLLRCDVSWVETTLFLRGMN